MDFISKIKNINSRKRFGYVEKQKGQDGKDYFFLEKDLIDINFDDLSEGVIVSFEPEERKETRYAHNIRLHRENKEIVDSNCILSTSSYLLPGGKIHNSELIIGIVSAVGSESKTIIESLKSRLEIFGYYTEIIKLSSILPPFNKQGEYQRIRHYMNQGDKLREESKNNAILSLSFPSAPDYCLAPVI